MAAIHQELRVAFRYLGNKTRIADWIADTIEGIVPHGSEVADPMCGTASVSRALADRGYSLLASDELLFPVLHAKARLLHTRPYSFEPVAESYAAAQRLLNDLGPIKGFFWREYSDEGTPSNGSKPRRYFTGENAGRIDAIRQQVREWQTQGLALECVHLLLHDLILAANHVANIAGTYGYYRSTWNKSSLTTIRLSPSPTLPPTRREHSVLQGRVEELAAQLAVAAVYLDPPYTKRQYGGNYHLLETLAQQDEPEPVGEGGLRDWYPQSSDFCSKRRVRSAFQETVKRLEVPWIFISYSEDALIPPDEMLDFLSDHGRVDRQQVPINRFRSNGGKHGPVFEHLYILEKY